MCFTLVAYGRLKKTDFDAVGFGDPTVLLALVLTELKIRFNYGLGLFPIVQFIKALLVIDRDDALETEKHIEIQVHGSELFYLSIAMSASIYQCHQQSLWKCQFLKVAVIPKYDRHAWVLLL
jgi:hypothetical protein